MRIVLQRIYARASRTATTLDRLEHFAPRNLLVADIAPFPNVLVEDVPLKDIVLSATYYGYLEELVEAGYLEGAALGSVMVFRPKS